MEGGFRGNPGAEQRMRSNSAESPIWAAKAIMVGNFDRGKWRDFLFFLRCMRLYEVGLAVDLRIPPKHVKNAQD